MHPKGLTPIFRILRINSGSGVTGGRVGGVLPGLSHRQCLVVVPPLSRTGLALFTHTALQMDICFLLCGAVPLPSFPRFCVRSMFPCYARPSVDSFPPAALPAFIGTMGRSDSLPLICPSSLLRLSGHTPASGRSGRVSRVTCQSLCHTCHGLRPRR